MNVLRLSPPPAGSAVSLLERLRDLFGDIPREGGRVRKLPPAVTLALWTVQCLRENLSLRRVLTDHAGWFDGGVPPSEGALAQARKRLDRDQLRAAAAAVAGALAPAPAGLLDGRRLKAIDGVDFTVEDTPANRAAYSCPAGQAQGCGFPVLSTLASLDLATGALEQLKLAQWSAHDLRLFLGAPELIARNDIAVADRAFDAFVFLAVVRSRQADAICRVKNNRRALSGAKQRIGPGDWKTRLHRPVRSALLGESQLLQLPGSLPLRLVHAKIEVRGHRSEDLWLATTLLDAKRHPAADILRAYLRRWGIELAFRDVKTSMDAQFLRVKSPEMAEKAVMVFFLSRNFTRLLVRQSDAETDGWAASFKQSMGIAANLLGDMAQGFSFAQAFPRCRTALLATRFKPKIRPSQPRAVKRRPKPYPYLTAPRPSYREIFHRNRYHKPVI